MGQLHDIPVDCVTDLEGSLSANGSPVPVEQVRIGQTYLNSRSRKRSYDNFDEQMLDILLNSTAIEENENAG